MSAINPLLDPESLDFILIGGVPSPGLADVTGSALISEYDKKRGKGVKGATLTYTGEDLTDFSVTLRFWEPEHFDQWDAYRPLLKCDPTKKTIQAVEIYHPLLEDVEIFSAVVHKIGQLEKIGPSYWSVKIDFIKFKKPGKSNATGTPNNAGGTGTGNGTPGNTPPTAQDAQQTELAALLKKAQEP